VTAAFLLSRRHLASQPKRFLFGDGRFFLRKRSSSLPLLDKRLQSALVAAEIADGRLAFLGLSSGRLQPPGQFAKVGGVAIVTSLCVFKQVICLAELTSNPKRKKRQRRNRSNAASQENVEPNPRSD
jgi:hypothetical protein